MVQMPEVREQMTGSMSARSSSRQQRRLQPVEKTMSGRQVTPVHQTPSPLPLMRHDSKDDPMMEYITSEEEYDTEKQMLQRRLWKSEELIKQLKHIVKAQHGKIEELRERLEVAPLNVRTMIADQNKKNMDAMKAENEEWRQTVTVTKGELAKAKREVETLRKANRRLKAMLESQGLDPAAPSLALPPALPGSAYSTASMSAPTSSPPTRGDVGIDPLRTISRERRGGTGSVSFADMDSTAVAVGSAAQSRELPGTLEEESEEQARGGSPLSPGRPRRRASTDPPATPGGGQLPSASRLSRLTASLPMLWRDQESPTAVLRSLAEIGSRTLGVKPSQAMLTVYLLDPWLRSAADAESQDAKPTVYFLGQGTTQLQVLGAGGAGAVRAEPPAFPDLQALPYCTKTTIAIAVQLKDRQFAVLQATAMASSSSTTEGAPQGRASIAVAASLASTKSSTFGNWPSGDDSAASRVATPKVLKRSGLTENFDRQSEDAFSFSESNLIYLQVACTAAAGTLAEIERIKTRQRGVDKMRRCMEVAVEVNKARSLPDFEQRAKSLLSTFFNVNTVRIFFFDPQTHTLLLSSAQMRKKEPTAYKLDTGIVGLVARRQQVMHIPNISQHPYIDANIDGLTRVGRPVGAQAAMLAGPLIVDADDSGHEGGGGALLIGVAQLLERKRKPTTGTAKPETAGAPEGEFSAEEQELFAHLLRVCTYSAWRTLKVQELSMKADGAQATLQRMLAGT